jgi:exodeoxyribonuclease V alpha subunit
MAMANSDSISGLIERVTYFNEESGFAVLRVKVNGRKDFTTVVGSLPTVTAGEWLVAEGSWVRDRDHGLQLRADKLTCTPPTTNEGIEKYLGSGMVKGIGPVYAKKLVGKFGDKIFEVIENYSARLEEVDGIGSGRRKKIKAAWAEQKFIRQIMVFLHSHGVSTSRAVRIYKTYGEEAIEKVRANPYVLAKDIHGIGFKTADVIARKIGIPRDSFLRATAGLSHVLAEGTQSGHCALPSAMLLEKAKELLGLEETLLREALNRMRFSREILFEEIAGEELGFLPALKYAEEKICETILQLRLREPSYPAMDISKALEWCQAKAEIQLAPSQRLALEQALSRRMMIITGGPGVGKTTLLRSILMILSAKKVRCLLCAPTGRAAKRLQETTGMPAQTIHRLLEVQGPGKGFGRKEGRPLEGDLLVVDECSMVDVPLMSSLLRALPPEGNLLLVGDVDQLPSVGPGRVLGDLIDSGAAPVARLTEVFRQAAQSRIITAAHAVNQGCAPELPEKGEDSDFYFVEREEPEQIVRTLVEMVRERIPRKLGCDPVRDIQVLCPMNRGSLGVRELNLHLQGVLNPAYPNDAVAEKFGWQFRVRDKVIQTENNYEKEVFNGDIGQVQAIEAIEREVTIRFDGRDVVYDFGELDEISLAYAITIHKSQGSEFPVVVIPLAMQHYMLLQRNLIYTGITRGKKMVVLIGQKKALAMAVRNNKTSRRYSGLWERLKGGGGRVESESGG